MKTGFLLMTPGRKEIRRTAPLALAILAGLVACSTPGGPVARADGTFTITRQSETQYAHATAMATQDAEAHCLKMGKKFKAIQTKETITSGAPVSQVHYACN